jgi:hypothetical protein
VDDAIVELFGPQQREKELDIMKFFLEFFAIPHDAAEARTLWPDKKLAVELAQMLVEAHDMEPEELFDQDELIDYVKDNFWDELHGH